jgi:hypothetical protein
MSADATTATRSSRTDVFLGWAAAVVPIGAWIVHISVTAALVDVACEHRWVLWIMHALTLVTALVCVAGIAIGVHLFRKPEYGTNAAMRFLGVFAAAIAFVNLLLIVWEGAYVIFLDPCR